MGLTRLAFLFLLVIIPQGCYYYKAIGIKESRSRVLKEQIAKGDIIILHIGSKAWEFSEIIITPDTIFGKISKLVGHEYYKNTVSGKSHRYKRRTNAPVDQPEVNIDSIRAPDRNPNRSTFIDAHKQAYRVAKRKGRRDPKSSYGPVWRETHVWISEYIGRSTDMVVIAEPWIDIIQVYNLHTGKTIASWVFGAATFGAAAYVGLLVIGLLSSGYL